MNRKLLLFLLLIKVGQLSAQQNYQPVDSFFNYYCKVYQFTMANERGKNFVYNMTKAAGAAFNPENNYVIVEAKDAIKKQYSLKTDKEALLKLSETNGERFIKTQLVELTNPAAAVKYDSVYRLTNGFMCPCLAEKLQKLTVYEAEKLQNRAIQECYIKMNGSDVGARFRELAKGKTITELKEMSDNLSMYMYKNCDYLYNTLMNVQKNTAFEEYDRYTRHRLYRVLQKIEKATQSQNNLAIDSLANLFTTTYGWERSRAALLLLGKSIKGKTFDQTLSQFDADKLEFVKTWITKTGESKYDIPFQVKYHFATGTETMKLTTIEYIPGNKIAQKSKLLEDLANGPPDIEKLEDVKIGVLPEKENN